MTNQLDSIILQKQREIDALYAAQVFQPYHLDARQKVLQRLCAEQPWR